MRRIRWLPLVVLAVMAVVACSDDGSSSPATLPPEITDPPTTAAPGTSTSPTALAPSPTPVPTTGPPSTPPPTLPPSTDSSSSAPASVVDITPPERDELLAANRQWKEVLLACGRQPAMCDMAALDRVSAGPAKARVQQRVEERVAAGLQSVADPERPTYYVVTDVTVGEDGNTGTVVVCDANGDRAIRINDPANSGDDEIIDDRLISAEIAYSFERLDGVWKATGTDVRESHEGVNVCPPA